MPQLSPFQFRRFSSPHKPEPSEKPKIQTKDDIFAKQDQRDKVFTEKKLSTWEKVKVGLDHMKHSLIDIYVDAKYLRRLFKRHGFREEAYTIQQIRLKRRITKDVLKFIPFSFFIVVPLGELALPLYMLLFPNSMPTQFLSESQIGKKTSGLVEKQLSSYQQMLKNLPQFANVIGMDPIKFVTSIQDLLDREGTEKDMMFYKISDFESKLSYYVKTKFDKNHPVNAHLALENQGPVEIEQIAKLLCIDYFGGYYILNLILFTFTRLPFSCINWIQKKRGASYIDFSPLGLQKLEFTFNSYPFSYIKRGLIYLQVKNHFRHIKAQDRCLARDVTQLDTMDNADIASIARQRGIRIERTEAIKIYLKKYWLPLSVDQDLPEDLLIWVSFMRFSYCEIMD